MVLSMYSTSYSNSLTRASILSGASSTSVLGGEIINSQRDHNRATFIISMHASYLQRPFNHWKPLDIGGSDSDTSRSTLAVNKPSTSGSVEDSAHASTSSSVRDLPYSSTSSSLNQEQSSVEEFSASTDSGTSSQSFFRETRVQFVPFRPWW